MILTLHVPILAALIEFEGVRVDRGDAAHRGLEACAAAYRARFGAGETAAPGAVEGVQVARELFRALGIDPTRRRPSSEALLNRALKGKPMPRINSLVDAGNWCSLDFLLPLGLYDRRRLRGPIRLRIGRAGEAYDAIGDHAMNLEGRYLLADEEGPFGSPITDSLRTAVSDETTEAVVVVYAPPGYPRPMLQTHAAAMAERVTEVCGGRAERCEVVEQTEGQRD